VVDGHEELYWNMFGTGWAVPIDKGTATVTGPADVQRTACYSGPQGSTTPCAAAEPDGRTATFRQDEIGDGRDLTVVIAYPDGSIANPGPIVVKRNDIVSGFKPSVPGLGGGIGLAVLGSGLAILAAFVIGRDRRYVGQLPGLTPGVGEPAEERRKPLVGRPPDVVEFGVPDGLKPGQVGTLFDEKADVVDVTATIVDFAVRRHLQIKQIGDNDWELIKLTPAPKEFLPYERTLFNAIFAGRDHVTLNALKQTFAGDLAKVRAQLYDDMLTQGWYKRSPQRTRALAYGLGVAAVLVSGVLTLLLAYFTFFGFVGLGLLVASVVLLALAGRFPARTGKGSAALSRMRGLRLYITNAEAEQIRFLERKELFSELMPYAIVFGLADHWAKVFAQIGAFDGDARDDYLYWYTGVGLWNANSFGSSMHGFTSTASTAVAAASPSASGSSGFGGGGFSGGGGGGGGGGSW
jgi:uncharacterized protein (TIGR04222 family)